jgi:hypothetical protein
METQMKQTQMLQAQMLQQGGFLQGAVRLASLTDSLGCVRLRCIIVAPSPSPPPLNSHPSRTGGGSGAHPARWSGAAAYQHTNLAATHPPYVDIRRPAGQAMPLLPAHGTAQYHSLDPRRSQPPLLRYPRPPSTPPPPPLPPHPRPLSVSSLPLLPPRAPLPPSVLPLPTAIVSGGGSKASERDGSVLCCPPSTVRPPGAACCLPLHAVPMCIAELLRHSRVAHTPAFAAQEFLRVKFSAKDPLNSPFSAPAFTSVPHCSCCAGIEKEMGLMRLALRLGGALHVSGGSPRGDGGGHCTHARSSRRGVG